MTPGASAISLPAPASAFNRLAQDEATCVVFGMPREASLLGAVDQILPLGAASHRRCCKGLQCLGSLLGHEVGSHHFANCGGLTAPTNKKRLVIVEFAALPPTCQQERRLIFGRIRCNYTAMKKVPRDAENLDRNCCSSIPSRFKPSTEGRSGPRKSIHRPARVGDWNFEGI